MCAYQIANLKKYFIILFAKKNIFLFAKKFGSIERWKIIFEYIKLWDRMASQINKVIYFELNNSISIYYLYKIIKILSEIPNRVFNK